MLRGFDPLVWVVRCGKVWRMGELIDIGRSGSALTAYLSEPDGEIRGGVMVTHEVWGLVDHIKDVADRFAAEGYLALAPDLLTNTGLDIEAAAQFGGEMADPQRRAAAQPKMREFMAPLRAPGAAATILAGARAGVDVLAGNADVAGRIGVVGFCFGGTYSYSLAVHDARIRAAVPYYGHCDFSGEELEKVTAPVVAFYGAEDEALMEKLPELRQKMHDAGVDFRAEVYRGTGHAFFNDTSPMTYDEAAADDAWQQTLEFLSFHLR